MLQESSHDGVAVDGTSVGWVDDRAGGTVGTSVGTTVMLGWRGGTVGIPGGHVYEPGSAVVGADRGGAVWTVLHDSRGMSAPWLVHFLYGKRLVEVVWLFSVGLLACR